MSAGRPNAIAVLGTGRAGGALAAALAAAGRTEVRLWGRTPARARAVARRAGANAVTDLERLLAGVGIVLIAVDDAAVRELAGSVAEHWPESDGPGSALHTAGARPASLLAPIGARGAGIGVFHPVCALTGVRSAPSLAGSTATVSGDARGLRAAREIARRLRMTPLAVRDETRPLLHLAAMMAAGDLTALLGLSASLVERCGVRPTPARALLTRLAASAIDQFRQSGAGPALTGPVPRGDSATVRLHGDALSGSGLDETLRSLTGDAHGALGRASVELLRRAGRLDERRARELVRALDRYDD